MRVRTGACVVLLLIAGCATQPPPPESWDGLNLRNALDRAHQKR